MTHTALKIEPIGFQQNAENERVQQTAMSNWQNFDNSDLKKSIEIVFKKIKQNFRVFRKPECM